MIIAILIGVQLGRFIVQRTALRAIALGVASNSSKIFRVSLLVFYFLFHLSAHRQTHRHRRSCSLRD